MADVANTDRVGRVAAELMEQLEKTDLPEADDLSAEVGIVAVVAEITVKEEDGPGRSHIFYRCSDRRKWLQAGLFHMAERAATEGE